MSKIVTILTSPPEYTSFLVYGGYHSGFILTVTSLVLSAYSSLDKPDSGALLGIELTLPLFSLPFMIYFGISFFYKEIFSLGMSYFTTWSFIGMCFYSIVAGVYYDDIYLFISYYTSLIKQVVEEVIKDPIVGLGYVVEYLIGGKLPFPTPGEANKMWKKSNPVYTVIFWIKTVLLIIHLPVYWIFYQGY